MALRIEMRGEVAVVTLDRPPGNLFDYAVYEEFKETFQTLGRDPDTAAVVLQAAGRDFSLGHDMAELQAVCGGNIDEHYRIVGEGLEAVYSCPKPTVAAAQGNVAGAGLAAVAACDLIVAADDAHFLTPEIRAGIIGCMEFLKLLLPKGLTRYYAYTGKPIPAYELYRCGAVLELAPAKEIGARALALAEELLRTAPPEELSAYKQYMNQVDGEDLAAKFQMGKPYGREFLRSPNSRELYRAFFEKRTPRFQRI